MKIGFKMDLKTFEKQLKQYQKDAVNYADEAIKDGCEYAIKCLKDDVPIDTGFLESTIGYEKQAKGIYEIYADAYYAGYVEGNLRKKGFEGYYYANIERAMDIIQDLLNKR